MTKVHWLFSSLTLKLFFFLFLSLDFAPKCVCALPTTSFCFFSPPSQFSQCCDFFLSRAWTIWSKPRPFQLLVLLSGIVSILLYSLCSSCLVSLALSFVYFLELKHTDSSSVWLMQQEAQYKDLYTIQSNTIQTVADF